MNWIAVISLVASFWAICIATPAQASDIKPTDEQLKAREHFIYFTDRFADNVEPVTGEIVANCIAYYGEMLDPPSPISNVEAYYDILGSYTGWIKARDRKIAIDEVVPIGALAELMAKGERSENMSLLIKKTISNCRDNELRAHNFAIAKEGTGQ